MTKVLVAIVFHSDTLALEKCLRSISRERVADLEVIVCDTSEVGAARSLVENLRILWHDGSRNAGYAWALNRTARLYGSGYDLLIGSNGDLEFLGGALGRLVEHAGRTSSVCYGLQETSAGDIAPYSVHPQLSVGDAIARWLGLGRRRYKRMSDDIIQRAASAHAPVEIPIGFSGSGAVLAIPSDVWASTGGLDESFFLFEEDRSFGRRLNGLGIKALLCGDCHIRHEGGFRSRGIDASATLEGAISEQIAWRADRIGPVWVLFALQIIGLIVRAAIQCCKGRPRAAWAPLTVVCHLTWIKANRNVPPRATDGLRVAAFNRTADSPERV